MRRGLKTVPESAICSRRGGCFRRVCGEGLRFTPHECGSGKTRSAIVRAGRKQKKEDKEGISGKKKRILVLKYPYRRLYGAGKGGNNESYGYSEKNR